jgi:hypothetical protein
LFYKPLLLPSNGIIYDKIIKIKEPTVAFMLSIKSGWLSSSENELIYSLIDCYTSFKNPEKILYKDSQFLYFYFLSLLNNKSTIEISNVCNHCKYKSIIEIDLADLDIKYATSNDLQNKSYLFDHFVFNFKPRTLGDNIESGIKNLQSKEKTITNISNFIQSQFLNGSYKDSPFYGNEIEEILQEIGIAESMRILDLIQYEDWGLPNYISHYCTECSKKNNLIISDPFISSIYSSPSENKIIELLKTAIDISASKTISYTEFLNTPISNIDNLLQAIQEFLKKKYGKGKSDYLEQFEEELG